ncbi:MAG: hypothetical protein V1859_09450 [archaeon]
MSKKAIAPLISTFILIIFAAALGIIVMSWSQSSAYNTQTENVNFVPTISLISLNGKQDICLKDNVLYFTLENNGEIEIDNLIISFIGDNVYQKKIDNVMEVGDIAKLNVDYEDIGKVLQVRITPAAGDKVWARKTIVMENIEQC